MQHPAAGTGLDVEELIRLVRAAGHEVHVVSTTSSGWEARLDRGADLIAVAGGDGTVTAVLRAAVGLGVPVAAIPMGTANNVACSLGLPLHDPAAAIGCWASSVQRALDLPAFEAPSGGGRFVESVGAGVFADLIAASERRGRGQRLGEARMLLATLLEDAPVFRAEVVVDGRCWAGDLIGVEVMNVPTIGPNVALAPRARPDDGAVDVALLQPDQRTQFETLVWSGGGRGAGPARHVLRAAESVVIEPVGHVPMHVDDRAAGAPEDLGVRVDHAVSVEVLAPSA